MFYFQMKVLWNFLSFLYWGIMSQAEVGRLSYELFILGPVKPLLFLTKTINYECRNIC